FCLWQGSLLSRLCADVSRVFTSTASIRNQIVFFMVSPQRQFAPIIPNTSRRLNLFGMRLKSLVQRNFKFPKAPESSDDLRHGSSRALSKTNSTRPNYRIIRNTPGCHSHRKGL